LENREIGLETEKTPVLLRFSVMPAEIMKKRGRIAGKKVSENFTK
jgi:hypothetical protein